MRTLGIKPSNVTFSILIKIYGKAKDLKRALAVLDDMKKESVRPGLIVYTCLI
jgi:pentatricopeptide repeat protein